MAKPKFPETLKAALEVEVSYWALGDALKKECPPGSKLDKIDEARQVLAENGIDYGADMLRKMRDVSKVFPKDAKDSTTSRGKRFPREVTWSVHLIYCSYPHKLQEWVEGHPGEKLTVADAKKRIKELVAADKEAEQKKSAKQTTRIVLPDEAFDTPTTGAATASDQPAPQTPQPQTPHNPVDTPIPPQPQQNEPQPQPNGDGAPVNNKPEESWEERSIRALTIAVDQLEDQCNALNIHIKSGGNTSWEAAVETLLERAGDAIKKSKDLLNADEIVVEPMIAQRDNVISLATGAITY